jgi:hypothetical protein
MICKICAIFSCGMEALIQKKRLKKTELNSLEISQALKFVNCDQGLTFFQINTIYWDK